MSDYEIEQTQECLWAVRFVTTASKSVHLGTYRDYEAAKAAVARHEETGLHYTQEAGYRS